MNAALSRYLLSVIEQATRLASRGLAGLKITAEATPGVPTPPPIEVPKEIPILPGEEVKEKAIGFVDKIAGFFKYDFFPNLWMYLTLIFMLVLCVLIFACINLVVRSITDLLFVKILRMEESSKMPAILGGIASIIVAVFLFQWIYRTFPALRPPVEFLLHRF